MDYLYSFFYYKQNCCYCNKILYIKKKDYNQYIPSCSFNCALNYMSNLKK